MIEAKIRPKTLSSIDDALYNFSYFPKQCPCQKKTDHCHKKSSTALYAGIRDFEPNFRHLGSNLDPSDAIMSYAQYRCVTFLRMLQSKQNDSCSL